MRNDEAGEDRQGHQRHDPPGDAGQRGAGGHHPYSGRHRAHSGTVDGGGVPENRCNLHNASMSA